MPTYYTTRTFTAPVRPGFPTSQLGEFAVGDFNGDGKLDFIASYFMFPLEDRATPVRVFAGDGLGGFTDVTGQVFPANVPQTTFARETVVADFNRDGRPDLFVADTGHDAQPFPGALNALILSSGTTGLANAVSRLPGVPDFSHSSEAADIDRDGDLDLFVGNSGGSPACYFLINDGSGNFTQDFARLPGFVNGLSGTVVRFTTEAFLDVDGDGDLDLFLGAARQNEVSVLLLNDGSGRFSEASVRPPVAAGFIPGSDAVDARVMDVNRDGRDDLIVNYSLGNIDPRRGVQILISRGDGTFADETSARLDASIQVGPWTPRVYLVDVNGDGLKDMVVANNMTSPFYLNDGMGHFVGMPALSTINIGEQMVPADVNGDGHMDYIAWRGISSGVENYRENIWVDPGTTQSGGAADEGFMGDRRAETMNAGAGNDTIVGGGGQDYLRGDDGNDRIVGGDAFDDANGNMGNDTVSTGAGEDYCVGGKDNDSLSGGADYDLVYGNLGDDTCNGDDGDDIVRGGQGNDVVNGGNGNDFVSGDKGDDTMSGGAGADVFHTFGDAGIDRVIDFNLAQGDRVQLDPGTVFTLSQVGADTVINMTGGGQMTLVGIQLSSLTGNWIFGA